MWLKLAKNDPNIEFYDLFGKSLILYCIAKIVWDVFHDLKNVKMAQRSWKICQFWPILATFYEFLITF
jgi:hypothetical protein